MTAGGAISGSPSSGATSSPSKAGSTTSRPGAASSRSECRPGKTSRSNWRSGREWSIRRRPAPTGKRLMRRYSADRDFSTTYGREVEVVVEPVKARFSTWYELFPRSAGSPGKHGTFKEVERLLPGIAGMGFDVLYLPPIHPIGKTHRK